MDKSEIEKIRSDLYEYYPNLHIFINKDTLTEVAGSFPVYGVDDKELDRYSVSIILPPSYPEELPVVYEVGGRIPRIADRHIYSNGSACIFIPDDRWHCFPEGSSFLDYLKVPLHNFFLGQTVYEEQGQWPFGEWSHDGLGVLEYYQVLLETEDPIIVVEFLFILSDTKVREQKNCPCGSGKRIKKCCLIKVRDLRKKIPPNVASSALQKLREWLGRLHVSSAGYQLGLGNQNCSQKNHRLHQHNARPRRQIKER